MLPIVISAIDLVDEKFFFHKARIGLVTNAAAMNHAGFSSRRVLLKKGFKIVALFSPEHGLGANGTDGEKMENRTDPETGLPVFSLYGDFLKPSNEMLRGLDAVFFDIPDVGCRFYTYLWTMTYVMESCATAGKPLVILDRPNPIGGNLAMAEGPMLDEQNCSSFIGRWNIPVRHSCTLGELANYFNETRVPDLQLQVVCCKGWNRQKSFFETGQAFIPTSPAIRDAETALVYPGTGLLEGIEIEEGRGTEFPFRQVGAPWVDATKWRHALEKKGVEGIQMEKVVFFPLTGIYKGLVCNGLHFKVSDACVFHPVHFGFRLISTLMECFPGNVKPRAYKTWVNPSGENHLERLTGVHGIWELLSKGEMPETSPGDDWIQDISPYLLY